MTNPNFTQRQQSLISSLTRIGYVHQDHEDEQIPH